MNMKGINRSKRIVEQVQEAIIERIRQGMYCPEQRMPPEERLAEELRVSRGTLRTALTALTAEGYIIRRQGDGTYVCPRAFQLNLHRGRIWDIELQIKEKGMEPAVHVIEKVIRPPIPEEISALYLHPDQSVLSVKLLFFADNQPIMTLWNTISTGLIEEEVPVEAILIPWLEFLDRYSFKKPSRGKMMFRAIPSPIEIAACLNISPDVPVLVMSATIFDNSDCPISLGREYYVGEEGFGMEVRNY
jgi:GntR family transcriptional regulator